MQYLAICLCCKDENSYLNEWLMYHFSIGVEHVIIYDNLSTIPIQSTIRDLGLPTKRFSLFQNSRIERGRQCLAYLDCLNRFSRLFQWIAFIDTDEFIVLKDRPDLRSFLKDYEHFGGLGAFWLCFGSNGHLKRPPSVLNSFTMRSHNSFHANAHIKSIVNTSFISNKVPKNPHSFHYCPGFSCVDENLVEIVGSRGRNTSDRIQINHYLLRSREEWIEKVRRGQGNSIKSKPITLFDEYDRHCNEIEDKEIIRLKNELRVRSR